jgi:hypothetical protein
VVDRVAADPDVDVATPRRGETWFRSHVDGRLLADLRWLGNQYRILLFRLPERVAIAEQCCTEVLDLARLRADRLAQETVVHDCEAAGCAPWVQYSEA